MTWLPVSVSRILHISFARTSRSSCICTNFSKFLQSYCHISQRSGKITFGCYFHQACMSQFNISGQKPFGWITSSFLSSGRVIGDYFASLLDWNVQLLSGKCNCVEIAFTSTPFWVHVKWVQIKWTLWKKRNIKGHYILGCPKKTLFLNFVSAVEPLVRTSSQSPRKKFQRYRPINDTLTTIWNFGHI